MVNKINISAIVLGVAVATPVVALDPAPVELGGFQMIPTLSLTTAHDDNPFSQNDAANPDGMLVSTIAPRVQFLAQQQENLYSIDLGIKHGIFQDSTDDNYTDFNLGADAGLVFNSRNSLDLGVAYLDGHEDRGSGSSQGIGNLLSGPTEYHDTTASATYTYGAASAKARVEFSTDYLRKVFDNFESLNENRDRTDISYGARLLYAVSADTDLTLEVTQTDVDFLNDLAISRDNDELQYFVGVEWEATGKTSGFAKLGVSDKSFDERNDSDHTSWGVGVVWEPKSYSQVTLQTSKNPEETSGIGNFIDTTSYSVAWSHGWNDQVSSNLSYTLREEDYIGSTPNQSDDIDVFGAKVTYAFDRWLDIGLAYDFTDKSSSISALGYDRNVVTLSFDLSL